MIAPDPLESNKEWWGDKIRMATLKPDKIGYKGEFTFGKTNAIHLGRITV